MSAVCVRIPANPLQVFVVPRLLELYHLCLFLHHRLFQKIIPLLVFANFPNGQRNRRRTSRAAAPSPRSRSSTISGMNCVDSSVCVWRGIGVSFPIIRSWDNSHLFSCFRAVQSSLLRQVRRRLSQQWNDSARSMQSNLPAICFSAKRRNLLHSALAFTLEFTTCVSIITPLFGAVVMIYRGL